MLRCVATCRALIVGSLLVVLAVCARSETSVASTIQASTASREAYVKAMMPLAEAALAGTFSASVDDRSCYADQLVEGFTLRRLRAVGSPATVRRELLSDDADFDRFDITKAQVRRITATGLWECLGIGQMVDTGIRDRDAQLSQSSIECLDAKFDSDPKAKSRVHRSIAPRRETQGHYGGVHAERDPGCGSASPRRKRRYSGARAEPLAVSWMCDRLNRIRVSA